MAVLAALGLSVLIFLHSPSNFGPTARKDFAQDYVMAKAVLQGMDPYLPMNVLGSQFGIGFEMWHHPSPHPPSFVILIVPLALLSYGSASVFWLLFSELCLLISLRYLFNCRGLALLLSFLVLLLWYPIQDELLHGQVMTCMLLLLTLGWTFLRRQQNITAGVFFGLALAVKPIAWPVMIFFLVKGKISAVLSAVAVFLCLNGIASGVMGLHRVVSYYTRVGGAVATLYSREPMNFSVFSLGPRLFEGTTPILQSQAHTEPLINAPYLATPFSMIVTVALVAFTLVAAVRCKDDYRAFASLICLSVIISPTAWWFYFVPLLIPLTFAWRLGAPHRFLCVPLILAPYVPMSVVPIFGRYMSFWTGLLFTLPLFAAVSMMAWLLFTKVSAEHTYVSQVPNNS